MGMPSLVYENPNRTNHNFEDEDDDMLSLDNNKKDTASSVKMLKYNDFEIRTKYGSLQF